MREPDPGIVRRAQQGDLDAFEALVRGCQADAWRFAYHLTRDRTAADDVTQDAFVRAYRSLATYRGDARFSSWLLRIVRNCAVDSFQRTRRDTALVERASRLQTRDVVAGQAASSTEERLRLDEAIRTLPTRLREAFVLIEVLGYDYSETAGILGVKTGTLKSRMHRARAALMRELNEETPVEM